MIWQHEQYNNGNCVWRSSLKWQKVTASILAVKRVFSVMISVKQTFFNQRISYTDIGASVWHKHFAQSMCGYSTPNDMLLVEAPITNFITSIITVITSTDSSFSCYVTIHHHLSEKYLGLGQLKDVCLTVIFHTVFFCIISSNTELPTRSSCEDGRLHLKCDGTRAETRFLLSGETDESI